MYKIREKVKKPNINSYFGLFDFICGFGPK